MSADGNPLSRQRSLPECEYQRQRALREDQVVAPIRFGGDSPYVIAYLHGHTQIAPKLRVGLGCVRRCSSQNGSCAAQTLDGGSRFGLDHVQVTRLRKQPVVLVNVSLLATAGKRSRYGKHSPKVAHNVRVSPQIGQPIESQLSHELKKGCDIDRGWKTTHAFE